MYRNKPCNFYLKEMYQNMLQVEKTADHYPIPIFNFSSLITYCGCSMTTLCCIGIPTNTFFFTIDGVKHPV